MEKKICKKCNIEKNIDEYYIKNKNKNTFRNQCKDCMNLYAKKYKNENKEKIDKKNKEYLIKNKEQNKINCLLYRKKNPKAFKIWVDKNKENRRTYINNYNKKPLNKLKNSLRSRINGIMNGKNKNVKTLELIGCSYEELMKFIENKFIDGMNWNNYGYYGWHVDHIIPLSSAKDESELIKLFHYTNLQPLWCKDNLSKNSKYEPQHSFLKSLE
jgi:hypothetical protein